MATRVMVIWCLTVSLLWVATYGMFSKYFDGADFEKKRVAYFQKELGIKTRQVAKLELNFEEYRDAMAFAGVKIEEGQSWTDPKRMLASVITDPKTKKIPQPQPGFILLGKAKKLYTAGDFKRSGELFEDLYRNYPAHPSLPEITYLLSECYYNRGQTEESVRTIHFLINHFPETEYSAYGLLRLGKIFEDQDRLDEAREMYNLVTENFKGSNAANLATKQSRDLPL